MVGLCDAFVCTSDSEIQSLLATVQAAYCQLKLIPTWMLKQLTPYMVPVIQQMSINYNLYLQTDLFPVSLTDVCPTTS